MQQRIERAAKVAESLHERGVVDMASRLQIPWAVDVLVDDFLPVFDVSLSLATVVDADLQTTWRALMELDLIEVGRKKPMVGALSALRALPEVVAHLVHGESPPKPPERLTFHDATELPPEQGGWVLLGERPSEEIALGMVGKFWRPVIEYAVVSPDEFRDYQEPGFAKTIYSLSVHRLDDGQTRLSAEMRTATTDPKSRAWFRRYWTLGIGSGAQLLVHAVLELTRERAEATNV